MASISFAELKKALSSLGEQPHVLSPYGFKITEHGGKKYLMALTKEERDKMLTDQGVAPASNDLGDCVTKSDGTCEKGTCTRKCIPVYTDQGFTCYCGF